MEAGLSSESPRPRRGWREKIAPGLRRAHRIDCASTADHREGRRCKCDSWQITVPGYAAGTTRTVTVHGTVADARRQRHALIAAGRPEVEPEVAGDTGAETLTDFAVKVLRASPLGRRTLRNYGSDYRLRIGPRLGHLRPVEITRERCEVFVSEVAAEASSHRVLEGTVTTLKMFLNKAVEWDRIPTNPAARLRLPARPPREGDDARKAINERQLRILLSKGSDKRRVQTMLQLPGEGGVRRGEIAGLRWPDVDLAKRQIRIRFSYDEPTKGRRARTIFITTDFARALDAWFAESVIEGGADARGYVWPGRDGGMMQEKTATQACNRAMVRAGLVNSHGEPLVTLHGLRHTCASILLSKGVPLIVVSRHLGHSNPNITARVYAHLIDDDQMKAAANAFEIPAVP